MPIPEVDKIWMNGELVDWHDAQVHVLTHALHYGSGVFEGIRAYKTERGAGRVSPHRPPRAPAALGQALLHGAALHASRELAQATKELDPRQRPRACYIRPLVFRGYGEMGLFPLDAPVDVRRSPSGPGAPTWATRASSTACAPRSRRSRASTTTPISPAAKARGQYLNSQLAKIEVVNAGYEEAIMLNHTGYVTAGHRREHLHGARRRASSRRRSCDGVLEGITRDTVMQHRGHALGHRGDRARLQRAPTWSSPTRPSSPARPPRSCRSARSTTTRSASPARSRARSSASFHDDRRAGAAPSSAHYSSTSTRPSRPDGRERRAQARRGRPPWPAAGVTLYDTTLRDGMQQEGLSVSVDEKVRIALKLDELGLHFIEGGFPASNPKETEFFAPHGARAPAPRRAGRLRHDAPQGRGRRAPTTNLRVLAECLDAGRWPSSARPGACTCARCCT